ncbi:hypothetical protein KUTeg_002944 [Tegillarca granosa]|uniref:Sperm-lysin n=1 Tax=Tegillarca granosa TaxID=220873 RepID=A0ABQ9FKN2_TEGGR|nr:hypothetical protein KUTeg_002944 [Tegillarca granosa]
MSRSIILLLSLCTFVHVEGVVPSNIPLSGNVLKRDELIKLYFMEGLKYAEIVLFLFCNHNIKMTIRHLKRILRKLNFGDVLYSTHLHKMEECNVSGQCVGYRTMWKRLIRDYGLAVKRNDVMKIMQQIFPNATEERKAHRLKRRMYTLKGPNLNINLCINLYGKRKEICCKEFKQIVDIIKPDVQVPVHPYEALRLFIELNYILEHYL